MFNTQLTINILLVIIGFVSLSYILFTRQMTNLAMRVLPKLKKRYVVCHLRYQAGLEDIYNVIPNPQGLTKVGSYSYELGDKYVALSFNKRKHYVLQENDTIPKTFEGQTDESIIFQAAEIQTALNNTVMEYLFSKKKDILILGLFIIAVAAILCIIYNIYEIAKLKEMILALPIQSVQP